MLLGRTIRQWLLLKWLLLLVWQMLGRHWGLLLKRLPLRLRW